MQKKETFPSLSLTISEIFCIHKRNEVKDSREFPVEEQTALYV
jgi:hypothetical protein